MKFFGSLVLPLLESVSAYPYPLDSFIIAPIQLFVKFFFKIFERLKFRLSERDGLQPCIPLHFVRLSRLYVLAFLTRFVGLAPLSSCAFIIALIQLFVKGFSKLFFVGEVESGACARKLFFADSQELRFCHPLDNYYYSRFRRKYKW